MFSEELKRWIRETLSIEGDFTVEHPDDFSHGDYSTNVAFIKGIQHAEQYVQTLNSHKSAFIEKIELKKPGFINFFLKPEFFLEKIKEAHERKEFYGSNEILDGQKYFIEHTQPNPFKEFHIGHLMNNAIGESLVRVMRANGVEVKVCSYHGDVGLHVAKAMWGFLVLLNQTKTNLQERWNKDLSYIQILDTWQKMDQKKLEDNIRFSYQYGNLHYESDEEAKKEIITLNKKIYEHSDKRIDELYVWGRDNSLKSFERIYKILDSHFDYHFYESEAGKVGASLVREHTSDIFSESEGAIVFKGEEYGLHTRVFLNSEGLPTYEAKELGLAKIKKDIWDYDQSLTVTANEQDAFFKVCECAIGLVFPDRKGKLRHISHGLLKLPTGKMSSRTGNVISAVQLIHDVKEKILAKMQDRDITDKDRVAEIVAIGAIKYSILRQATGKDIIFDFDTSLSFEGDSGPYLQYSYVRARSILDKAEQAKILPEVQHRAEWQTTTLEKLLARFGEVVFHAGEEYAPHYIATYLIELASVFNAFYAVEKIIDTADSNSPYKIALTSAFAQTMKNGLNLLGIEVPEKM